MLEVRIHGRGGAGVKMSAQILGRAAFLSGYHTQDFAMYGAERRGAPVVSFCRIDKNPILERGYVGKPDVVMILDDTLNFEVMLRGLKKDSIVLINTNRSKKLGFHNKPHFVCIDATSVALKVIGKPIPNTIMLGGLIRLLHQRVSLGHLQKAIEIELSKYPEKIIEGNKRAARIGYGAVYA